MLPPHRSLELRPPPSPQLSFSQMFLKFLNHPSSLPFTNPHTEELSVSSFAARVDESLGHECSRSTFSIHRSCVPVSSISAHQDAAVPRSSRADQPARCNTALARACLSVSRRFRPRFARYFHQRGTRGRAILLVAGIIHNSPVSPLLRLSARSRTYVSLS